MFANTWYFSLAVNKLDWLVVFLLCNMYEELKHGTMQISEKKETNFSFSVQK